MKRGSIAEERAVLMALDRLVGRRAVRRHIDGVIRRLERRLARDRGARMAWKTLPMSLFRPGLPQPIRSGWVFLLRGGAWTGAERHSNSHQRTMSYRGAATLKTGLGGRARRRRLRGDRKAPLMKRWATIPPGTWHDWLPAGGAPWAVVSFHTVRAGDLAEEKPRPGRKGGYRRMRYVRALRHTSRSRD